MDYKISIKKAKKGEFLKLYKMNLLLKKMSLEDLVKLINEIEPYRAAIEDGVIVIQKWQEFHEPAYNAYYVEVARVFKEGARNFIYNRHPAYMK